MSFLNAFEYRLETLQNDEVVITKRHDVFILYASRYIYFYILKAIYVLLLTKKVECISTAERQNVVSRRPAEERRISPGG